MNQTENIVPNSNEAEERIRKVYVEALKPNAPVHTVFKATQAEVHTSRAGKKYLALTLVDRTGQLDARIFENVDGAAASFTAGDYLLVQGKVGAFQGKKQLVIERLERLDPGPIDAAEFAWVAPPAPSAPPPAAAAQAPHGSSHKEARQRVLRMLDDPRIAVALDGLLTLIEERIQTKGSSPTQSTGPRVEKRPRPPRHERKAAAEGESSGAPPKRDPSLPEGLSFKPLTALVGEPSTSS